MNVEQNTGFDDNEAQVEAPISDGNVMVEHPSLVGAPALSSTVERPHADVLDLARYESEGGGLGKTA
jgi:hypothetical protein